MSISKEISNTGWNVFGESVYSRYAEFGKELLPFLISERGNYEAGQLKLSVYDLPRTGGKVLEASEVKRSFVREPQIVSSWKECFSLYFY